MKIQLRRIVDGFKFVNELSALKLKAKDSFRLIGIVSKLKAEYDKYEEVRVALIKEHSEPNEKGEIIIPEGTDAYITIVTELDKLLAEEVEIDITKLSIDALGDNEIEVYKLVALDFIFDMEA